MKIFRKNWLIGAGLLLFNLLLLSACSSVPWTAAQEEPTPLPTVIPPGLLIAEGRLAPVHTSTLQFQTGGELGELLVSEGDAVIKGDVLARLGKREPLEASLSQARLELLAAQQALDELEKTEELARQQANQAVVEARIALNQAQTALNNLDTDEYQEELDDLAIAVQDAQEELDDAKEELDKYLNLDPDNTTRKNAQADYDEALRTYNQAVYDREAWQYRRDQARTAVALANARLANAQRQSDKLAESVDPDSLALAQGRLEAASAQVTAAERALANMDLVAPYDGVIVELNDLQPGELVSPGQTVAVLADFSSWIVETRDLNELDVVKVEAGMEVEVTPDALPELTLAGTVESIDQVFSERSGDILFTVRIRLAETDPLMRWGMTVSAVFEP